MNIKALTLLTVLLSSTLMSHTTNNDRCSDWNPGGQYGRESKIYIMVCEYESGNSGYYRFKNGHDKAIRISFELTFNSGKTYTASANVKAYSESSHSSCYSCANKNSGVKHWSLKKIAFEGEDGYF